MHPESSLRANPTLPNATPERDPVPSLAREVIDLYRGPLASVRFPDLDRDELDASEAELLEAQREVEAAERALEIAREQVAAMTATLLMRAQRGLAYARVFAEGQPELREHVDAISLPAKRSELVPDRNSASAPRRTRRSRKDDGGSLFEAPPVLDASEPLEPEAAEPEAAEPEAAEHAA